MRAQCLIAALLAVLASIGGGAPALAEDLEIVYWPLVTDGTEYRRVAYPAEAGTIVAMADTTIRLDARWAKTLYWPITRETVADVAQGSAKVEGTFEIVAADGTVTTVPTEPYLVWHPEGVGGGTAELVRGARAAEGYETYVRDGRAAAAASQAYQRIVAEHQAAVEAWLKLAAQRPRELPAPPPELDVAEPDPYRAYASEPEDAALLSLPAGTYSIRIRAADGTLVAGSERTLVSFAPLAEGVGYVVRPGDRWTQPVVSFAPDETIYTTGRSELFLQPVPVVAYVATHFTRLFQPQSVETVDPFLTVWVPRPPGEGAGAPGPLDVFGRDGLLASLPFTPFRVAQLPGKTRGYEIVDFTPRAGGPLKPDFSAMRMPRDLPVTRIALADGPAATVSSREVRRVVPAPDGLLFLPALLPLAFGVVLRLRGRLKAATVRRGRAAAANTDRLSGTAPGRWPGYRPIYEEDQWLPSRSMTSASPSARSR